MFDILVRPVEMLSWNTTSWVEAVATSLGGNGANTAFTIARLGVPARQIGFVGRDVFGEQALARLRSAGVDLRFVEYVDAPTAATVALVRANGDRMFLHHPGASASAFAAPVEFTDELIEGCGFFHLGNAFALPQMRRNLGETLRRARAAGLSTAMDTGWDARGSWLEDLGAALPHTDLLFVNEEEASKLSGCSEYAAAADRLRELGAGTVIVKRGGAGCAVFSVAGRIDLPAFDVPVVDTTGAGDCFAGAFLAALARNAGLNEAAQFANAVGALTVQQIGATTGVRGYEETLEWMRGAQVRKALEHF